MKTIRLKENDEKIIIKLKLVFDLWLLLFITLASLAGAIFFLITLPKDLFRFIFFTCSFVVELFFFFSWLWRGITINKKKKTVTVYSFTIRKFNFEELSYADIRQYTDEYSSEPTRSYPHLIFCKKSSKHPIYFRTRDKEQAQEIILHLGRILQQ